MIATAREVKPCVDCGTMGGASRKDRPWLGPIRLHGRCARCRQAHLRKNPWSPPPLLPCRECGTMEGAKSGHKRPIRWKGLCSRCYFANRRTPDDGYVPSPLEIAARCQMIRRESYRPPQGYPARTPRAHRKEPLL